MSTPSINSVPLAFNPPSLPIDEKNFSNELSSTVKHSKVLNELEKMFYSQMIHCVASYGLENNMELFNAAGFCFDVNFGSALLHNIITIQDYLTIMGGELQGTLGENDDISTDFFAHDRPGFFLLQPNGNVYFLKEGAEGSLVYYDPQRDTFVESSSLRVSGQEKLVILNKSAHPTLETYHSEHTSDMPVKGYFYHEKQDIRKCGIHALHAFLGFPVINETHLSLMKLEELTNQTYSSDIHAHYLRSGRKMVDLSLLPWGQIAHFKNTARFKLAQTSLFQADLGNNGNHLVMILQQMAMTGAIDKKYTGARKYEIYITKKEVDYAKEKGLFSDGQIWDENISAAALKAVNEDLAKDEKVIANLDERISKIKAEEPNPRHPLYQEYIQLLTDRKPYDILQLMKQRLENSLQGMKELQTEFQRSDRLIIASQTEDHSFTLRKCENEEWVIIDSLIPEQVHITNPLKWLTDRQKSFFGAKGTCCYEFITLK